MNGSFPDINAVIKAEANALLQDKRLLTTLHAYGTPHLTGSYDLDLMTWRDLDIYLQVDECSEAAFFSLGGKLCTALSPVKMSFRNELLAKTQGLPAGLYWGIYLGNERAGAWKLDIWAVGTKECERLLQYCTTIKQKLTPETRATIRNIKSQCWQDPAYRRSYSSADIYDAVLEKGITDIDGFRDYLRNKK